MADLLSIFAIGGGIGVGFCVAWYIKNKEITLKDKELAVKDQEIAIERRALEERSKDIDQLESRFKAVAGDVLREHSKDFLGEFEKARKVTNADLESKEKNFDKIVGDLKKSTETVSEKMIAFEKARAEQVGSLGESIKNVLNTGAKMQEEVGTVKSLLSSASAVRGKWGELLLTTILEQSDLNEGVIFHTQETITGENANLRPDVIITLPDGLKLAIDSKASLEEFSKAVDEKDNEKRKEHIVKLSQNIRGHIKDLASKEYQKHLDPRVPYVVMFIPSEAAIRAVAEEDVDLYREAQEKRVMLASPATIMPLLSLIAHAWRQQKTVENASKLAEEITDLGGRLKTFFEHVSGIGSSLENATKKFNAAAGSWDRMVSPKLEKINTLGGNMRIESQIHQIEIEPRMPQKLLSSKDKKIID
jgi:DNA recombination protein RmuC